MTTKPTITTELLTQQQLDALIRLTETGLFGQSVEETAQTLITFALIDHHSMLKTDEIIDRRECVNDYCTR